MGQVFAALGCDTYIGLGTDSPKPSVDGAVWEWECSDGSWQAYDDVAQRLLEEHWMKMKSDETTDDHIVLLPTVEGGYAANLADMTETEIGRKAGFRKLQRCKPWDRTMRRLTQSIVDSSKFGEARSPTVHERVEAELAAEQRRARQAIEIAALDAERAERATTVRNSWSGWEYSAQISAQQQGEPTEDEIWESLPPEASITQTGSSIDNSDEYDEDAELAAALSLSLASHHAFDHENNFEPAVEVMDSVYERVSAEDEEEDVGGQQISAEAVPTRSISDTAAQYRAASPEEVVRRLEVLRQNQAYAEAERADRDRAAAEAAAATTDSSSGAIATGVGEAQQALSQEERRRVAEKRLAALSRTDLS